MEAHGNHWLGQAIEHAHQFGDAIDVAAVQAEYAIRQYPPKTCRICGGHAHYKHTVGTHKCIDCGALQHGRKQT